MIQNLFAAIFLSLVFLLPASARLQPLVPVSDEQNEAQLLQDAQKQEPVVLKGGYQQYDLVVARLATWDNGEKEIVVRLILPPKDKNAKGLLPVVAYIHGGGFIGGNPFMEIPGKEGSFGEAFTALLDEGFAVASMGYRLAREAGWPAPVSDVLCGLRFLTQHGKYWGVDASHIGISGHSAGARLAALVSACEQNAFHHQDLPWQGAEVRFSALWIWAGSAWDWPRADQWVDFGKPRYYSVPRLLFGEHPAHDYQTRHRLRIRSHLPHLSMKMPPLYQFRGASDYGGDHSDAQRAVEVWNALGIEATLDIKPGGHNEVGPLEPFTAFFKQHAKTEETESKKRDPLETAFRLLEINEPLAAIEVLVTAKTSNGGYDLPSGEWMILHNGSLMWHVEANDWNKEEQMLLKQARSKLALAEATAANTFLQRGEWYRAETSARNAVSLGLEDDDLLLMAHNAVRSPEKETAFFSALHKANTLLYEGKKNAAVEILEQTGDQRSQDAIKRITAPAKFRLPEWADNGGVDIYGQWISLEPAPGISMRFRLVDPGTWDLPTHLFFRNSKDEPMVKRIQIENGFWLAETETTHEQWMAITGKKHDTIPEDKLKNPVAMIDYLRIVEGLNQLDKKYDQVQIKLPSEAEWLYAGYYFSGSNPPANVGAVHAMFSEEVPGARSVDSTLPNQAGYKGLLGGVMEWTSSPGNARAYVTDSLGRRLIISYPIARGGAWSSMPHSLDFGLRKQQRHGNRQPDLGFRVAIVEGEKDQDWLEDVRFFRD